VLHSDGLEPSLMLMHFSAGLSLIVNWSSTYVGWMRQQFLVVSPRCSERRPMLYS